MRTAGKITKSLTRAKNIIRAQSRPNWVVGTKLEITRTPKPKIRINEVDRMGLNFSMIVARIAAGRGTPASS